MVLPAPEFVVAELVELLDQRDVAPELEHRVFADRVVQTRALYGDEPLVAEILAFIDSPSHRGLIRAVE